jgi:hypothetical protein
MMTLFLLFDEGAAESDEVEASEVLLGASGFRIGVTAAGVDVVVEVDFDFELELVEVVELDVDVLRMVSGLKVEEASLEVE